MSEARAIPMAEAVVRVMKEFRKPLERKGKMYLFDAFEDELNNIMRGVSSAHVASDKVVAIKKQPSPLLRGDLLSAYLKICKELNVEP